MNAYQTTKSKFEGRLPQKSSSRSKSAEQTFGDTFMSLEEFTRYRDQTSSELYKAYREMIREPEEETAVQAPEISNFLGRHSDNPASKAKQGPASGNGSKGTKRPHFLNGVPSSTKQSSSTAATNGRDTGSGGDGWEDAGNNWSAAKALNAATNDIWSELSSYQRWIVNFYNPEMIKRFGGLNVVEKGLFPMGMVNIVRESRFKWQD